MDSIDAFALNAQLVKEAKLVESLHKIGFSLDKVSSLISLDMSSKSLEYGIDIRDTSTQWLNDFESDKKYNYWSKSLQDLLRPTYPGMLRSVARNIFNLVLVVDPASDKSKTLIKTVESFYVNDMPIRIGKNPEKMESAASCGVSAYRFNKSKHIDLTTLSSWL
jgi:UDP-glucose:glycoprotein glucosyltransferase